MHIVGGCGFETGDDALVGGSCCGVPIIAYLIDNDVVHIEEVVVRRSTAVFIISPNESVCAFCHSVIICCPVLGAGDLHLLSTVN